MVSRREPDDLCPSCGVPVPLSGRGARCPYCGYDFEAAGPHTALSGYLTTFGYGMCGLFVGGQIGLSTALCRYEVLYGDPRSVLYPVLGSAIGAALAAGVGSKLDAGVRRGFEAFLLSLVVASVCVSCLAMAGVDRLDALGAVGLGVLCIAGPLVWRLMYAPRRGRTMGRGPGG